MNYFSEYDVRFNPDAFNNEVRHASSEVIKTFSEV